MSEPRRQPLPKGLPHIAYVLLWYPLFTQPFIFREVEGLKERLPLTVYTLYGANTRHLSREMAEQAGSVRSFGVTSLGRIVLELLRQCCTHPLRLGRLFARTMLRRWNSLEVLGENLWAFCVGLYLGRLFVEEGIDIIYAPWPRGTTTAAWVAASISGLPFGTSARGDNLAPADPDLGDKLAAANFIRTNNAADKGRIEAFGRGEARGKVTLVYNSLSLPERGPERVWEDGFIFTREHPLRFLALGRFDVTKGFDVLLKACGLLRDQGIPFTLTLAGGGGKLMGLGNLEGKLRALRAKLHLESQVFLPGLISHNALPRLLGEHHVFVAPCVIDAQGRRDGIPNTVIEAMAFGLPVVGTTVNALPEVIHDGTSGLTVPQRDVQALARAMKHFYQHPGDIARFGACGAQLARDLFDSAANSNALAQLFVDFHREQTSCVA